MAALDVTAGPIGANAAKAGHAVVRGAVQPVAATDAIAPIVAYRSPASGATLGLNESVEVDLTDDASSILVAVLIADFPYSRVQELVFDGSDYGRKYTGSRAPISGGWRFSFSRVGGWPRRASGAPERLRLSVVAFDAAGNAVVLS